MKIKLKLNYLLPLLFILLLISLLSGCGAESVQEDNADLEGKAAEAFTLPELNSDEDVSFPDDFKEKKTALVFFSRE